MPRRSEFARMCLTVVLLSGVMPDQVTTPVQAADPVNVGIRQTWSGMLPTASLKIFAENQRQSRVACITSEKPWKQFWNDFDADGALPKIDFETDLIVVAKNVRYLNRVNIRFARLDKGTLKVLALETRTARPSSTTASLCHTAASTSATRMLAASRGCTTTHLRAPRARPRGAAASGRRGRT